jgi:hypothetical protein
MRIDDLPELCAGLAQFGDVPNVADDLEVR